MMHKSVVLQKLRKGEVVWCGKTNLTDPNVIEIMGHVGVHCVWLCMEHCPISIETVHNQIRTAKMVGMDSMVRVAKGSYSDFIRPLEMDATGIMVPHCMSGQEAAEIVRKTRFHPVGLRPWDGGNSDGPFCMRSAEDYMKFANTERFLVVQVEDKEAVDCMEDIVATPGIDVVFLGPGDLSHSLGVPGQPNHPLIQQAIDKLATLCKKHNRFWGLPCGPDRAPEMIAKGARFLAAGADVIAIVDEFKRLRDGYRSAGLTITSEF
jgi:4-hydroxy-2-oxoheptanedioate aldolase